MAQHQTAFQALPTEKQDFRKIHDYAVKEVLKGYRNVNNNISPGQIMAIVKNPTAVSAERYRQANTIYQQHLNMVQNLHIQPYTVRIVAPLGLANNVVFDLHRGNLHDTANIGRVQDGIEKRIQSNKVMWIPNFKLSFGRLAKNPAKNGRFELKTATYGDPTIFGAADASEVEFAYSTASYSMKVSQLTVFNDGNLGDHFRFVPNTQGGTPHGPITDNTASNGFKRLVKAPIIVDSETFKVSINFADNTNLTYTGTDPDTENVVIFEGRGYSIDNFASYVKSANDFYIS
ncbi:MAG: hypothetical protein ACPG5B_06805 [Chitinophagales bacterium]